MKGCLAHYLGYYFRKFEVTFFPNRISAKSWKNILQLHHVRVIKVYESILFLLSTYANPFRNDCTGKVVPLSQDKNYRGAILLAIFCLDHFICLLVRLFLFFLLICFIKL